MSAVALLQVSPFSLAGVDTTTRKTVVEGNLLILAGSIATITLVAGGTQWAVNDLFNIAGPGSGGIGRVTAVTAGVATAVSLVFPGVGYSAVTGAATTAIAPSTGSGLTVTTTVTANGGQVISITGWSITANVLTFTANNTLTTGGGQSITVTGFSGTVAFLNGTYTTTSATATTIVVPLTHANGSGSQIGNAVITATYIVGGIPISYAFIDLQGNPNPIGTIGPISVPTWIEAISAVGGASATAAVPSYLVNILASPNLLRVYAGAAEATAAAVPADVVVFRAEFVKNAF